MHRNHPGSKVVIFDSSGHSPFVDEHERFFGLIKEFVTKMPEKRDASQWKGYLKEWEREKKEDPVLQSETSQEEREAIREFEKAREEITEGKRFEGYSSPLNIFLTFHQVYTPETLKRLEPNMWWVQR